MVLQEREMDHVFENDNTYSSIIPYIHEIIVEFPYDIGKAVSTSTGNHLFNQSENSALLDEQRFQMFHSTVAKVL